MEFELSKIDAAVEQLDWAIKLFLDQKAYVPAITLAASAEEILVSEEPRLCIRITDLRRMPAKANGHFDKEAPEGLAVALGVRNEFCYSPIAKCTNFALRLLCPQVKIS